MVPRGHAAPAHTGTADLPPNWQQRTSGDGVYYLNTESGHSQYEHPTADLPPNWQQLTSGGGVYYLNTESDAREGYETPPA